MITQDEILAEKEYLKKVLEILNNEIENFDSKVKSLSNNIQEQMSYAWDKTNRLSDTEFVYALANIQKRSIYAENANKKVKSYKKMLNNAYFARIDFDNGEEVLPIYIGISSLEHNNDFFVYDWRAPISSLFYNSEVGKANYTISTGEKVEGTITLKRQYRISNGEIQEMFDTDIQIIDSVLKNILSANASPKMRNIVNTIQKEQNTIIRKNDVDLLVVQGPAGSGKTSIAMHKIAYLLYSERDKINNSNVMILSPNEIFNNYISDVLPEIGEDNVCQATFFEYAKAYIPEFTITTTLEDVYEVIYGDFSHNTSKYNEIRFKYSKFYIKLLEDFIENNKLELYGLEDIIIDDQTILSLDEMYDIAKRVKSEGESIYMLGKKIVEKIYFTANQKCKKALTLEKLKKQALENLAKIKIKISSIYKKLYTDKQEFLDFVNFELAKYNKQNKFKNTDFGYIFDTTSEFLSKDEIEFQDVTPYMYLKSKIIGISANKNIKYVLIDEAQDYSLTQYKILSMLFKNSNITLLGDLNQSILPFSSHDNYDDIVKIIKSGKQNIISNICNLNRTYRSTFEINEFAKKLLPEVSKYSQIDRHGDEVSIFKRETSDIDCIIQDAINLKNSYNTVAIICKNLQETLLYRERISSENLSSKFRMVTKNDNVFVSEKIMIIPSYLAKGLEFDAVIISNCNSTYYTKEERNLLYVVLTRALHKLNIYYSDKLSELISGDNNEEIKW